MFNGNLSEGATVTIEGCAISPFVTVIKSLYMPNNHLGWVKIEIACHSFPFLGKSRMFITCLKCSMLWKGICIVLMNKDTLK